MGELINLRDAADQLGIHYMTAYRHVRTGRLPAVQRDGRWYVDPADLAPRAAPGTRRRSPEVLAARMVAGDESGSWAIVEGAMASGADPEAVHLGLLAPALRHIGDEWAVGRWTVADEHRASTVAGRLIGRLGPRFVRRGPVLGTVVVGAAPGDGHALPSAILGDLLRAAHLRVLDLGADPTPEAYADSARGVDRLVAVLIGATTTDRDDAVRSAVAAAAAVGAPVLVGGAAISGEEHALALGAHGWTGPTAADAVAAVLALPARRQP